jgi:hypothetical protein
LKETQALGRALHSANVTKTDFSELCMDLGANPKRGISLGHFMAIYADESFGADAEEDYRTIFGDAPR